MSYIDIAIIVIVSLCALIGLKKGLFKSVVSLLGWLVTLVAAVLLTKTIAYALLDVKFVGGFVAGSEGFSLFGWVRGWGLSFESIPSFLEKIMGAILEPVTQGALASYSNADGIALYISYFIYCAIVFLLLFIAIRIVVSLILMFIKSFAKNEKPSGVSRLIGFLVGAVRGAVLVVILMFIVHYALAIPQLSAVGDKINESVIAKPVLEQVQVISDRFLARSDDDTINKLIDISGIEVEEGSESIDENTELSGEENVNEEGNENNIENNDNKTESGEESVENNNEFDNVEIVA